MTRRLEEIAMNDPNFESDLKGRFAEGRPKRKRRFWSRKSAPERPAEPQAIPHLGVYGEAFEA